MTKKNYIKPTMNVVQLHTARVIAISQVSTDGLGSDNIIYDKNGGNQENAWSRGHRGIWDEE